MAPHRDVRLSKALSWLLRHAAEKEGLQMEEGGFINVERILQHPRLKSYSTQDIERVVANNDKQRFALRTCPVTGKLQIRANQGHSLPVEVEMEPILSPSEVSKAIHGTYLNCWNRIQKEGISCMGRNHIHMAPSEPGSSGVISGMRSTCQIHIYVDVEKAMQGGITFFRSANNVILSPGNEHRVIPPEYFQRIVNISTGEVLGVDSYKKSSGIS